MPLTIEVVLKYEDVADPPLPAATTTVYEPVTAILFL
jgi:hypothetical protein